MRIALRALLVAALLIVPVKTAVAQADAPVVTLPAPTGSESIGVVSLHLVDENRVDEVLNNGRKREFPLRIFYPAVDAEKWPADTWAPEAVVDDFREYVTKYANGAGDWRLGNSHARVGAPAAAGPRPILLYSPGFGSSSMVGAALIEELVSHGYVVAALDHPGDVGAVVFPGDRVVRQIPGIEVDLESKLPGLVQARVDDARYALDALAAVVAGRNPDAEQRPLPAGLGGVLDLSSVGMFGHSLGGATSAQAMLEDPRIRAGVDMDGSIFGSVRDAGVDRPFLLMSSGEGAFLNWEPSRRDFFEHSRGAKLAVALGDSLHMSFSDLQVVLSQLAAAGVVPHEDAAKSIGTIPVTDSIDLQRGYLRTFFNTNFGRLADSAQAPWQLAHPQMRLDRP
ncbi:alpha/beta hydrolase family protein [Nocardia panacis]|uniref:alpha/beta hydrolase family protein n=1 Tax=Nocardia panacis TaxID=2340916 RepID=UPI0013154B50|nr:hypothetical protein [Nocardia panacis]